MEKDTMQIVIKRVGVAILISNFKTKNVISDKETFIMLKSQSKMQTLKTYMHPPRKLQDT